MGNGNGGLNTLDYVQKLEHAGMPREQAEAQASALYEVINSNLATKQDLEASTLGLKHDIELVKKDIKGLDVKIETIRSDLKKDIGILKRDMMIGLGSLLVTGLLSIVALAKLGLLTSTPLN